MTREEAETEQRKLEIRGMNPGWWYGTSCEKCCGLYPRFRCDGSNNTKNCWYECDVCGKRTDRHEMPWAAREAWNRHEYMEEQIRFL